MNRYQRGDFETQIETIDGQLVGETSATPTLTAPSGLGAYSSANRAIQPLSEIPRGVNVPRTPWLMMSWLSKWLRFACG